MEFTERSLVDLRASDPEQDTSSLPSSQTDSDDITTSESDDEELDANQQWQESLEQLELLLSMVIVPYAGKYFGRKFAFWGWKRYMEWMYPVEVVVSSSVAFKGTGIAVAASL